MKATLTAPSPVRRELPNLKTLRLAELVQHLTGSAPVGAIRAVEATRPAPDPLSVVAGAMVRLRRIDLR